MGLIATPVEKAERRLADIGAELANARAAMTPDIDFDEGFATREHIAMLERKEAAAEEALTHVRSLQSKAEEEAKKTDAAAEVEAYRREAERVAPSHLTKIEKLVGSLTAELEWLDGHVDRAADINRLAREFGLPGVTDGELLHRQTSGRTVPAQFEEREVWEDAQGEQPSQFREHPETGELVPASSGYEKRRRRVQVRAEQVIPATLPGGRLAANIRLMNLKGKFTFS